MEMNREKKIKLRNRLVAVFMALVLLAAGFTFGFVTRGCTQSRTVSSYEWVLDMIKTNYYDDVSEEDVLNASLKGLTGGVLDIYSAYYTAEEYRQLISVNEGNRTGIGVSYTYLNNAIGKGIYLTAVLGNSPAYRSGLRAGTIVQGAIYGDESLSFTSSASFTSFVGERADGEIFTLLTDHGEYEVYKGSYVTSYCFMATNASSWDYVYDSAGNGSVVTSDAAISYLPDGAAYLSLSQFYGNAAKEMAALFTQFNAENCTSLILDLRSNGGGLISVLQNIAYLFTGSVGVAMTAKYKDGSVTASYINAFAGGESILPSGTQVYVLANNGTASASEALIGVLVSYGVIGYENIYLSDYAEAYLSWSQTASKNKRTYGKGIMQSTFVNYNTGEAIKLTTAQIYWPNGKSIHGVGLTEEDGCHTVQADWVVTYEDEELQRAVQAIYG